MQAQTRTHACSCVIITVAQSCVCNCICKKLLCVGCASPKGSEQAPFLPIHTASSLCSLCGYVLAMPVDIWGDCYGRRGRGGSVGVESEEGSF